MSQKLRGALSVLATVELISSCMIVSKEPEIYFSLCLSAVQVSRHKFAMFHVINVLCGGKYSGNMAKLLNVTVWSFSS